mmetsp:Transcript_17854/g.35648  ORF Transcript_17854/g.35648 Transcript_17854/m.35648 type:complete len:95 (-) Transcript_17854:91-375(-)
MLTSHVPSARRRGEKRGAPPAAGGGTEPRGIPGSARIDSRSERAEKGGVSPSTADTAARGSAAQKAAISFFLSQRRHGSVGAAEANLLYLQIFP